MKTKGNWKKWIARLLVAVMILTCVPMYDYQEVKAASYTIANNGTGGISIDIMGSPYSDFSKIPTWGENAYKSNGCAWFASARARQITNKNISMIYSGQNWYNKQYKTYGLERGQEIKAPALICYSGHVAILEKLEGDTAYISEGGLNNDKNGNAYKNWGSWTAINPNNGHCAIHAISKGEIKSNGFLGFVYLTGSASAPAPVAQGSVRAVWAEKYDHNMVMKAHYYNPSIKRMTVCGITVKDGNTVVARKEEMHSHPYAPSGDVWFDINKDCGVTLRAGHVYSWQIYVNIGGTTYYTDWINDRTTGTEKPNPPSFSVSKKDYAVGDAVTVSWGSDPNATQGYSLTITQTKGKNYTKTLTTSTYNAASLAFSLPNEGEYKLTGFARGSEDSEVSTLNKTIVAHAPSKVRFVELDKEGEENLLCEQTVRYGYSATAPINVSRKGHTFTGWKGEYSNVTSDRTITAQFKRNTYKIVFTDKDGKTIKTESVLFEDDAAAPEPPEAETGYVFAGWDSEKYKNVQGNATVKATYVWANDDLPVVITLNKCEFHEDGYIINYDIKNNPNKRTKGRALVSLKTTKGKLLDSTESKAFSLAKGEEKKGVEIYCPYEGAATVADLYIINGFSKGIPISEVESVEIAREWSDWSPEKPAGNKEVETRKEYRFKELLTSATRTSNNEGWTFLEKILDTNWNFGGWSGWARANYSASETATTKREVQTRNVSDNNGYQVWVYYYWKDPSRFDFSYYNEGGNWQYYEFTKTSIDSHPAFRVIGSYNGQTKYYVGDYGCHFRSECWFLKNSYTVQPTTHTEMRYRDGTKGYTYYWNKWGDWSEWSTAKAEESATKKAETRDSYRYRASMDEIEDNTGKKYTISGKVDPSLAGKQAALLVYKNDEPSDSNNEFVGQTVIGADGSYSYTFIPKQEISSKTGDYSVCLALEGAENPVFLEKIIAPKPEYTVTFLDDDGNVIDVQKVLEGSSAASPKAPDKEHYSFVGWDYGFTNVRDDLTVTAQYVKNKYSVAFVNWETNEAETQVFSYGDPVTYPKEKEITGYKFVGWTTMDGEKIEEVTDNTVLQANYEIISYTVTFYDNKENEISVQSVQYGKDAREPEHQEMEQMVFKGWSTYAFHQVSGDVNVYPIYEWIETTETPVCSIKSGVYSEKQTVRLSSEEGAEIYYTTDGTLPTRNSNKYDGEFEISANTVLQFMAVSPGKNVSETQLVSVLIASGEDDHGALVIKKENYNLNRGEEAKITYFLSHEDSGIGVRFYSLNEEIASVSEEGVIRANQVGETQILVSTADAKYADYCNVKVTTTDIDAETIVLNASSVIGIPDETIQMEATVYPDEATDREVDWYIEDESVASVSEEGEIKILKKGTTMLRAVSKNGSCYAECSVEGVVAYSEDKLQISSPYIFLYENDKDILYTYYGDADINCRWESTNEEVATVEDGMITARKAGQAVIIATAEDGTQVTSIVIVNKNPNEGTTTGKPEVKDPTENKKPETPQTQPTVKKPQQVKGVKVKTSGKKKLRISWTRFSQQDGFEMQYALNKSFTKGKKTKRYSSYTNKVTLKKLKSKKTYYVRIRAYKNNKGQRLYGAWSAVKKCKVK